MSLFASALAGAAKGVGDAAASLANRYIDEEMAMRKAEALADLQRRTAGAIREDEDAFRNDPTRVERDRQRKRQDVLAAGEAARESELAGLKDAELQGARATARDAEADAEIGRKARATEKLTPYEVARERSLTGAREEAKTQAMRDQLPMEVQAAAQKAEAVARAQAKYREKPQSPAEKLQVIEQYLKRELTEQEKLGLLGMSKGGGATEEVTTESTDEKGVTTKRVIKGQAGLLPVAGGGGGQQAQQEQGRRLALEAVAAGKGEQVVQQMEAQGLRPAQIVAILGEDNYAKIKGTTNKLTRTGAAAPSAGAAPANLMAGMSTRDLQRLASIQGHARQRDAQAELERRASEAPEMTGIGYGVGP